MTELKQNDIVEIIALIRVNFENAYASTDEEAKLLVRFWYESLNMYDRNLVLEGAKNAVRHCQFAPKLSDILNEIKALESAGRATEEQLWAELTGVLGKIYRISRYLPYPQYRRWADGKIGEIFGGLSEDLKDYLVNQSALVELSEMTAESLAFEKNRFFRRLPVLRQLAEDRRAAERFLAACNHKLGIADHTEN